MAQNLTLTAERVDTGRPAPDAVGESPVWRAAEAALYWVDITGRTIHRLETGSGAYRSWNLPEQVGCITFDRQGGLLAGMESGLFRVTLADHAVAAERIAAPDFPMPGMRFNDGRCDRQGRFWAGTMLMDNAAARPVGSLYRFDGTLSAPLVDGLITQNGIAFAPDGTTMYLSDSHSSCRRIWSFDFDTDDGSLHHRRLFLDLHDYCGRPDGAAMDAEGCYWICANDAGCVLRFTPEGRLDRKLRLPASKPSMCAFGGPGLDTLFITTIRPAVDATEHDGHLFAATPGVTGAPEAEFGP